MAAAAATRDGVGAPLSPYAGIVTRAVALAIDAAVIWVVLLCVGGLIALVESLVGGGRLGSLGAVFAGGAALGWNLAYFAIAWAAAGRTVGQRMMQLRVIDHRGRNPRFARSILRAALLGVCVAFAGLGFVPVLFDRRRRGLHDILARTTVRYDTDPSTAASAASVRTAPAPLEARHIGQITTPRLGHRVLE